MTQSKINHYQYNERAYRENLRYSITKRLLMELDYTEEQAQNRIGIPQHLLNAIDSTLDVWVMRNSAFKQA